MRYVIRSMSTSDWNGRDPVVPYHIYLLKPERRAGAWWTRSFLRSDVMTFDTLEEAQEELARCQAITDERNKEFNFKPTFGQIVPEDARGLPSYWEYHG